MKGLLISVAAISLLLLVFAGKLLTPELRPAAKHTSGRATALAAAKRMKQQMAFEKLEAARRKNDPAAVEAQAKEVLKSGISDYYVDVYLADFYDKRGEGDKVKAHLSKVLAGPNATTTEPQPMTLWLKYADTETPEERERVLSEWYKRLRDHHMIRGERLKMKPEALANLLTGSRLSGDPQAALPYFKRAADIDPHLCDALEQYASALESVGRRSEARAIFLRAYAVGNESERRNLVGFIPTDDLKKLEARPQP